MSANKGVAYLFNLQKNVFILFHQINTLDVSGKINFYVYLVNISCKNMTFVELPHRNKSEFFGT